MKLPKWPIFILSGGALNSSHSLTRRTWIWRTDQVTGHENAVHEIAGHGIAGHSLLSSVMECLICVGMLLERDRVGVNGNGVGHINKVKPRRTRLVLGLVTTCGGSTIPVLIQVTQRPIQPGHPSVGRYSEYWRRFQPPLGKKRRVLRNSEPRYQNCWLTVC